MSRCALPGCRKPMTTGQPPYCLAGIPEVSYCSRACVGEAWEMQHKKKSRSSYVANDDEEEMNIPAPEFGDSGVLRKICDRSGCRNVVALCWKGRNGEYCSNACYKLAENAGQIKTEEEENQMTDAIAEATAAEKPITAGTVPAKKGAAKKAAPKKGAAKKAAPAKAAAAPAGKLDGKEIKALKGTNEFRGRTKERVDLLIAHDGKTVEKFRAAFEKKKYGSGPDGTNFVSWYVADTIKKGVAAGLVAMK